VLLHQFGQDLVLLLELPLQDRELAVLGVFRGFATLAGLFKGRGAVVEELLLPAVEAGRRDAVLVTPVAHRLLLQEVEPQDGHLLRSRVVLALAVHGMVLR
jgi:hypothetical protein